MKIEMDDEATITVIVCIMTVVILYFGMAGCRMEREHTRWQQEHSITNR